MVNFELASPLSAMHSNLVPGTKFECIAESGEANSKFTMAVTVEGQLFKGSGDYNYFFLTETLGY